MGGFNLLGQDTGEYYSYLRASTGIIVAARKAG
jgi:hypothetical protein